MPWISVQLEVAPRIMEGLANGTLTRMGGVVRDAATGEIVSHLKEIGNIVNNPNLAGGGLKMLMDASTGGLASVGFGALDTVISSQRHNQIMQQFSALTNLTTMVGGIGLINLGVSAVSLAVMVRRFNDIEKKIDRLFDEFEQDREANLQAGLDAANDASTAAEAGDMSNAREYAVQAIDRLREARKIIHDNVKKSQSKNDNKLLLAHLSRAMQVDAVLIRSYLENEDFANVKRRLSQGLPEYRKQAQLTVNRLLGDRRAVFFHPTVSDKDLWRFVEIRRWLSDRDVDHNALLAEAVLAERHDFWNPDVIADIDATKKRRAIRKRLSRDSGSDYENLPRHLRALADCDGLIENYRRMQGFQAEIEAIERLGISHSEWQKAQDEALAKAGIDFAEYDDYVFLVNTEQLESLDRNS